MAENTWHSYYAGAAFTPGCSLIDLHNAAGADRFQKCREIYVFNTQQAVTVAGVITTIKVVRFTAAPSGGTAITPLAHDSGNSALEGEVTSGTGRTITDVTDLLQLAYSTDEPGAGDANLDMLECLVPYARIWSAGLRDTTVEPLVLPAGYGVHVRNSGLANAGVADCEIVFTDEAS
jgi:hypothetical protein